MARKHSDKVPNRESRTSWQRQAGAQKGQAGRGPALCEIRVCTLTLRRPGTLSRRQPQVRRGTPPAHSLSTLCPSAANLPPPPPRTVTRGTGRVCDSPAHLASAAAPVHGWHSAYALENNELVSCEVVHCQQHYVAHRVRFCRKIPVG